MKKFLQTSLVLLLAAAGTQSSFAENTLCHTCRIYVEEFAIKKGETKVVNIILDNPDYDFTAIQFDMYFKGGLTLTKMQKNFNRVPEDDTGTGAWQKDGAFRYLLFSMQNPAEYVEGNSGALLKATITTDETFGTTDEQPAICFGGELKLSDIATVSDGAHVLDSTTCIVYEALDLAHLSEAKPGKNYAIANPFTVSGQTREIDGVVYNFVTDGDGNWMKVASKTNLEEGKTYDGCQFVGTVANDVNPEFTVNKTFGTKAASSSISSDIEKIDMAHAFDMVSNQVIAVTGFFFNDDNQETLRAYSGKNGERGQSLTVNNTWSPVEIPMTNGKPYTINKAAVQLKAAWETPAGAKVAPAEGSSFQNYVIYPLEAAQIATGVDGITASKEVSSVRFYNVAGIEANEPFNGMNIMVTTYTDGTTSTAKVIK